MAVEFSVRLDDVQLTAAALIAESRRVLATLLGTEVNLEVFADVASLREGRKTAAATGRDLVERTCTGTSPPFAIVANGDRGMTVVVTFVRIDAEGDPEGGDWLSVEASRSDGSCVVAIAVAVAAATLVGSVVVDEWEALVGTREAAPAAVVTALASVGYPGGLADAARAVIGKTRLHQDQGRRP